MDDVLNCASRVLHVRCDTLRALGDVLLSADDPKELIETLRLILVHDLGYDPLSQDVLDAMLDIRSSKVGRARQDEFRRAVAQRDGACILSGYHVDECEAAHIVPFCESLSFDPSNGILLNRVLHKLFDDYAFSIVPDTGVVVAAPEAHKYMSLRHIVGKRIELQDGVRQNMASHYDRFLCAINGGV